MKFGRYTAHRRIQHACGARQQASSPTCPTPLYVASLLRFRTRARYSPGVGLPRRSRGSPGDLGTVEWGNAVRVHEPSGISVRILGEGSLSLIVVRDGSAVRTAPADESTRGGASRTRKRQKPRSSSMPRKSTVRDLLISVLTARTKPGARNAPHQLRLPSQLPIAAPRAISSRVRSDKGAQSNLLRKQTQHH